MQYKAGETRIENSVIVEIYDEDGIEEDVHTKAGENWVFQELFLYRKKKRVSS